MQIYSIRNQHVLALSSKNVWIFTLQLYKKWTKIHIKDKRMLKQRNQNKILEIFLEVQTNFYQLNLQTVILINFFNIHKLSLMVEV